MAAVAREPTDQRGIVLGRYRLINEIGRGGMGTVWMAERADGQFEQRVALKLIKRGMDTDEILARFLRERQILARLEHPNIARLLDGGVSDDGRPYFVMEHVAGQSLTAYCDEKRCSIEERLRLFVVVARAVAYAHRNLIVHRDIKPSNVLVGEGGDIKLLDFGIAKLLTEDPDSAADNTMVPGRLMTPEYASPEQREGRRVTTASDIYQLGVLLYQLLTGQRPRADASGATLPIRRPSRIVRQDAALGIRDGRMETVGHVAVAEQRGTSPERLSRRLRGDLDTIVQRLLREEPDLRYPSAESLADDVERHLAHRPIQFGGSSARYRTWKFVRRHRLGVATGSLATAFALGIGAIAVTRIRSERDRARAEADKATEVAQLMSRFLQGWSPDASDRGEVSTKKLLADAALRADRELRSRPDLLGATLSLLGDFHTTVGEWKAADTLLARAYNLQEQYTPRSNADVAATLVRRGRLYRLTGLLDDARRTLEAALEQSRELYGVRHPETLRVQSELANVMRDRQEYREAEPLLRGILAAVDTTGGNQSPFALETMSALGYTQYQLGRFDDAVAVLRPTLDRQRELFGDLHASTLSTMRALGSAERDRGHLDEAEGVYRQALRIARTLYGPAHTETESVMFVLALCLSRKLDPGAEELMRQDMALFEQLYGRNHPGLLARRMGIAAILLDRDDRDGAERELRAVLSSGQRAAPNEDRGDVLNRLAYILVARGGAGAERAYNEAVAYDDARSPDQPDFVTDGLHYLAWAEHKKGDLAAAEKDYRRALAVYERYLPPDHPYRIATTEGLKVILADSRLKR
jgi:serine/threonine-protein kinase